MMVDTPAEAAKALLEMEATVEVFAQRSATWQEDRKMLDVLQTCDDDIFTYDIHIHVAVNAL